VWDSILRRIDAVAAYVPGYRLTAEPQFDDPTPERSRNARVAAFSRSRGNGKYLPAYAGILDIMTAAVARVGELRRPKTTLGRKRT
jgi:acetaldehyde dehydrogenase